MKEILIFGTVLLPIVAGLVEMLKVSTPINKNYLPFIAIAVGLLIGFLSSPFSDSHIYIRLWAGGLSGLAASGFFDTLKHFGEGMKKKEQ